MKIQELSPSSFAPEAASNAIVNTTEVVVKRRDAQGNLTDEVADSFNVVEIEENDRFLFSFPLPDDTRVILRESTGKDRVYLQQISVKNGGNIAPLELMYKLVSRLCVKWGDADGIKEEYFLNLSHRKLRPIEQRLEAVVAHFFRD